MKKFKLSKLSKKEMKETYAGGIKGGFAVGGINTSCDTPSRNCSCACRYADNEGSSTSDNDKANDAAGISSK